MIISNLVYFTQNNYNLPFQIINKIDLVIRDSENLQPGQFFSEGFKLDFSYLKIESKDSYDFLKSHKILYEIIYIQSGNLNFFVSNRIKTNLLNYKFDESEYDFFSQENFMEVKNLTKSDLIYFDSTATYKILANSNVCKLILFKLSKYE